MRGAYDKNILANFLSMKKSHTVYISFLDNRKIKCSCKSLDCKIGINFDENVMLLTDRYGNEHPMYMDKKNTKDL